MILFGWGRKIKVLGSAYKQHCDHCGNDGVWQVICIYRYFSLFFIPVAKWEKQYAWICPTCERGVNLDGLRAAQRLLADSLAHQSTPVKSAAQPSPQNTRRQAETVITPDASPDALYCHECDEFCERRLERSEAGTSHVVCQGCGHGWAVDEDTAAELYRGECQMEEFQYGGQTCISAREARSDPIDFALHRAVLKAARDQGFYLPSLDLGIFQIGDDRHDVLITNPENYTIATILAVSGPMSKDDLEGQRPAIESWVDRFYEAHPEVETQFYPFYRGDEAFFSCHRTFPGSLIDQAPEFSGPALHQELDTALTERALAKVLFS